MHSSYAQNFEDVVLWRGLREVPQGTYVDVGASDPIVNSVTWSFYQEGWRGVNIEPVPSLAAALRERRPEDTTLAIAAGSAPGTARLFAAGSTGNSTLVPALARDLIERGIPVSEINVPVATLDEVLKEAGLDGKTIHFCTIDVEGSELDVLDGFDLARWQPWILVIEATLPNRRASSHHAWEPGVLEAGYQFCLFDGLNRFYVHQKQADVIAAHLSYPACVLDEPFERAVDAGRRIAELERIASRVPRLERQITELERVASRLPELEWENSTLQDRGVDANAQLAAIKSTLSWRATRPLRAVRRKQLRWASLRHVPDRKDIFKAGDHADGSSRRLTAAFARRLAQAAHVLDTDSQLTPAPEISKALADLEAALDSSKVPDGAKAWLSLVAAEASYPDKAGVDRIARLLRMEGHGAVSAELIRRFERTVERGSATTAQLDVVHDGTIVDVTHTVSTGIHTGIQRVVRETVARWIDAGHPINLVNFGFPTPFPRLLAPAEYQRLTHWKDHLGDSDTRLGSRAPEEASGDVVIPWRCQLVLPELSAEPAQCRAYHALASASVLRSLSLIGYDLVPMVAAETASDFIAANFGQYLSVLKHAKRVSAISRSSAHAFAAFAEMTALEGLPAPIIEAHQLPTDAPDLTDEMVEASRLTLGIGAHPVIVMVGSHEPRKNHLGVLEAAERLWTKDAAFELLLIGGSGWNSEELDEFVEHLISVGRPIQVRKRCSEQELWAAYRLARFTVFPSFLEGFGLPVAESLASGTPVITSRYGSMAEIGAEGGGGALLVDPRSIDELECAMRQLLEDKDLLGRLRKEATLRDMGNWNDYARDVWQFFVDDPE